MQLGFEFGTQNVVPAASAPWLDVERTAHEYRRLLVSSLENIQGVQGLLRDLYERALAAVPGELSFVTQRRRVETFSLSVDVRASAEELTSFCAQVIDYQAATWEGFSFKVRQSPGCRCFGVHIDGVGSLVLRAWSSSNCSLSFDFDRDTFFNESFHDTAPVIEWPVSQWMQAVCPARLAQGPIPSVPTVLYGGRHYLVSGASYHGPRSMGTAWTVCAREDWQGVVYNSNQELLAAYARGTVERGDHRGQLVRVGGRLCVIDGAAQFVDNQSDARAALAVDDTDNSDDVASTDTTDTADIDDLAEACHE